MSKKSFARGPGMKEYAWGWLFYPLSLGFIRVAAAPAILSVTLVMGSVLVPMLLYFLLGDAGTAMWCGGIGLGLGILFALMGVVNTDNYRRIQAAVGLDPQNLYQRWATKEVRQVPFFLRWGSYAILSTGLAIGMSWYFLLLPIPDYWVLKQFDWSMAWNSIFSYTLWITGGLMVLEWVPVIRVPLRRTMLVQLVCIPTLVLSIAFTFIWWVNIFRPR